MAQRFSEYERREANHYPTPAWVTEELLRHLDGDRLDVWEPACGEGFISTALQVAGHRVMSSDIRWPNPEADEVGFDEGFGWDFLDKAGPPPVQVRRFLRPGGRRKAIITNPPYGMQGREAAAFTRRALELMKPVGGMVAMLLKADFNSGHTRTDMFRDCPAYRMRLVLHERIVWFEPKPHPVTGRISTPSENHCWFCWDYQHAGPPIEVFGRSERERLAEGGRRSAA